MKVVYCYEYDIYATFDLKNIQKYFSPQLYYSFLFFF